MGGTAPSFGLFTLNATDQHTWALALLAPGARLVFAGDGGCPGQCVILSSIARSRRVTTKYVSRQGPPGDRIGISSENHYCVKSPKSWQTWTHFCMAPEPSFWFGF